MLKVRNSFKVYVKDANTDLAIDAFSECTYAEVSHHGLILTFVISEELLNTLDQLLANSTVVKIELMFYKDNGAVFNARDRDKTALYLLDSYTLTLDRKSSETMAVRTIFYENTI